MGAMVQGALVQSINQKFNARNILLTAQEMIGWEERTGQKYVFGNWVPRQNFTPDQLGGQDVDTWGRSVGEVPELIRKAMTELIRGNLFSDNPTPMIFLHGRGDAYRILVDYGQDDSVSPAVPAIVITQVCPR